jgi:hypothetical protein
MCLLSTERRKSKEDKKGNMKMVQKNANKKSFRRKFLLIMKAFSQIFYSPPPTPSTPFPFYCFQFGVPWQQTDDGDGLWGGGAVAKWKRALQLPPQHQRFLPNEAEFVDGAPHNDKRRSETGCAYVAGRAQQMPQNADRTQRPPVPAHGSTGMTRF